MAVDEHFTKQTILGAAGDKWNRQLVGSKTPITEPSAPVDGR
jgi:hypothetical protein